MLNSSLHDTTACLLHSADRLNKSDPDDPLKRLMHHELIHIGHINTAIRPDWSHGHASGPGSFHDLTQGCHRSPLPKVVPNGRLIKPLPLVEEPGDVIIGVFQEGAVNQEANPLREKIQKTRFSLKTWRRQPDADWLSPSWGPC